MRCSWLLLCSLVLGGLRAERHFVRAEIKSDSSGAVWGSTQRVRVEDLVAQPVADPVYAGWVAQQIPVIPVNPALSALVQGLAVATNPGIIMEFGVFTGTSINLIATNRPQGAIFGFDSFQGLPDVWRGGFDKGAFDLKGQLPAVAPNVQLVPGWFNETLPGFLTQHAEPLSLLHVDCDMYSSTKTVFDNLAPRIVPGTVIVFDEIVNYPEFAEHEMLAFYEFIKQTGHQYQWIGAQCPVVANGLSPLQGYCCSAALKITV